MIIKPKTTALAPPNNPLMLPITYCSDFVSRKEIIKIYNPMAKIIIPPQIVSVRKLRIDINILFIFNLL